MRRRVVRLRDEQLRVDAAVDRLVHVADLNGTATFDILVICLQWRASISPAQDIVQVGSENGN